MYAKVFASLWDGTLGTKWQGWTVFVYMLANCDREGFFDVTPEAMAARSGLPLQVVKDGLQLLESEDPDSRRHADAGARIVRIDPHRTWGWQIVNYLHYRGLMDSDERRKYMRDYMRKRRLTAVNNGKRQLTHAEADVEVESKHTPPLAALAETNGRPKRKRQPKAPEPAAFVRFYEVLYPKRVSRDDAAKAWRQKILFPDDEALVEANTKLWTQRWAAEDRDLKHVPHPATFLRAGTWREPPPEE